MTLLMAADYADKKPQRKRVLSRNLRTTKPPRRGRPGRMPRNVTSDYDPAPIRLYIRSRVPWGEVRDFERKNGISGGRLQKFLAEEGTRAPGIDLMIQVARGLGVSVSEVLQEEPKPVASAPAGASEDQAEVIAKLAQQVAAQVVRIAKLENEAASWKRIGEAALAEKEDLGRRMENLKRVLQSRQKGTPSEPS